MKDGPLWSRVSRRVWRSTDFRDMGPLPPSAPTLWFYLLSGEHNRTIPGLFVLGVGTMCDDLRWPMAAVRKHLATLIEKQHVKMDPVTNLVWLPKALDHNLPDNPNMVVGWKRDWQCMPACALKDEAREALRERLRQMPPKVQKDSAGNVIPPPSMTPYSDSFAVALGERSPNPSPNPSGKPPKDRRGNDRGDQNPNGGGDVMGNVTPTVRDDLTGYVDLTEREREEGEKAKTPPRARTSEGARGPARESDVPEPEVVDQTKGAPSQTEAKTEAPKPPTRPVLVPSERPSTADLLDVMAKASNGHFDIRRGNATVLRAIGERFRAYDVGFAIARRMGSLMATPHKTFPTATGIGEGGIISILWLMGSPNREGTYNAAWLGDLVSQAEAAEKADARRAERSAAAEAARQRTPGTVPAAKTDAATLAALRGTLRQSASTEPSDALVTLATGAS